MDGFDEEAECKEHDVDEEPCRRRGNRLQRIHDRRKRKVFTTLSGEAHDANPRNDSFKRDLRNARNAASPRKNREFKKEMVVGDGTPRLFHSSSKNGCNQLISN